MNTAEYNHERNAHQKGTTCTYAFMVDAVPVHCILPPDHDLPRHVLPPILTNPATYIETGHHTDTCVFCREES